MIKPKRLNWPLIESFSRKSFAFKRRAPKIAGIASKKEKLKASSFLRPAFSPAEIVLPERETPGKIARA